MTDQERGAALEAIAAEIRSCTRCRLHEARDKTVPGEGNPDTEVVVVGEGPGRDENQAGRPFVGASGRLLTELIESLGWRRDDVFITNVVKCWPPGNRDPQPDEIAACAPYLQRQLEVLDPAVVVTAGKHSLNVFMPGERIGRVHGTSRPADPSTGAHDALVFAMYHPAFALYDGSNRSTLQVDIHGLPATLEASRRRREERSVDHSGAAIQPIAAAEPAAAAEAAAAAEPAAAAIQPTAAAEPTAAADSPTPAEPAASPWPVAAAQPEAAPDPIPPEVPAPVTSTAGPQSVPPPFAGLPSEPDADQLTLF